MIILKYLTSALLLSSLAACGDKSKNGPHYDESWKKHDSNQDEEPQRQSEANIVGGDETAEINTDNAIDPDRLVFSSIYQGNILKDKIRFLYTSTLGKRDVVAAQDSAYYSKIKDDLSTITAKPVDLHAQQSYGDGIKSIFTQTIKSPTDNTTEVKLKLFNGDSASGVQTYKRIYNSDCPAALVCVNQINIKPDSGNAKTFCFADAETGDHIAIPLGASPGASLTELSTGLNGKQKRYGPYFVKRYDSNQVDCTTTIAHAALKSKIMITVSIERDASELQRINKETKSGFFADYGVAIKVNKSNSAAEEKNDPNIPPYIDELTGMQARTVYFFNQENKSLVRIKKELRKPITDPYLSLISGYEGILAEVEFRFCKDLLNPEAKNACVEGQ